MGWVFIVIPLLICCLKYTLFWLLNYVCLCTGDMCRLGVYIWGEGKKYYLLTKHVKKKYIFVQFGDFPMTYQIKGGKWAGYL